MGTEYEGLSETAEHIVYLGAGLADGGDRSGEGLLLLVVQIDLDDLFNTVGADDGRHTDEETVNAQTAMTLRLS